MTTQTSPGVATDAFLGSLVADALSMPVHWYYDRDALLRDYGRLDHYAAPRNPHPDSILWRSSYVAKNKLGDILHDEAKFWGQRGIHYHQHLAAGENTLNFQLALLLFQHVCKTGRYDAATWLEAYIDFMLSPGRHNDTYVEEYHRHFFDLYSAGKKPAKCGGADIHIGGLAMIPALFAALPEDSFMEAVKQHVGFSHDSPGVMKAARDFALILQSIRDGKPLREAIEGHAAEWISPKKLNAWADESDLDVVGRRLSPACYIDDAFPASLYLAWKYADDFSAGIIANAMVGGDNCHRGAVVGALLGAAQGVPAPWIEGLVAAPSILAVR